MLIDIFLGMLERAAFVAGMRMPKFDRQKHQEIWLAARHIREHRERFAANS